MSSGRWPTTSSSSARATFDASSLSSCASLQRGASTPSSRAAAADSASVRARGPHHGNPRSRGAPSRLPPSRVMYPRGGNATARHPDGNCSHHGRAGSNPDCCTAIDWHSAVSLLCCSALCPFDGANVCACAGVKAMALSANAQAGRHSLRHLARWLDLRSAASDGQGRHEPIPRAASVDVARRLHCRPQPPTCAGCPETVIAEDGLRRRSRPTGQRDLVRSIATRRRTPTYAPTSANTRLRQLGTRGPGVRVCSPLRSSGQCRLLDGKKGGGLDTPATSYSPSWLNTNSGW
jgi:hypothetical protein